MSGYDGPGEGWREVRYAHELGGHEHVIWDSTGLAGSASRMWVRDEPVPPLPTEPHTRIRVMWRDLAMQSAIRELTLDEDGAWRGYRRGTSVDSDPRQLARGITGFDVLAEPSEQRFSGRALRKAITEEVSRETAKAVLDRVRERIGRGAHAGFIDTLAREFGVVE